MPRNLIKIVSSWIRFLDCLYIVAFRPRWWQWTLFASWVKTICTAGRKILWVNRLNTAHAKTEWHHGYPVEYQQLWNWPQITQSSNGHFWRIFPHDGKIIPGWWGWGVHGHPLSLYLTSHTKFKNTPSVSWPAGVLPPVIFYHKTGGFLFLLIG